MARQAVLELVGDASRLTKSLNDAGKQAATFGDKVQSTGRKMSTFVTVPIVGFLGLATKAAAEDEQAQAKLAKTLQNTTGASSKQVAQVEKWIETAMKQSTFTDDELRPAFARLVTSTKDAREANELLGTAMDIAAATGKPLETVTDALAKAHDGQAGALSRLGIDIKGAEDKTASFEEIMRNANSTFGDSAANALDTTAGRAGAFSRDLGELKEKIGAQLLPVMDKLVGFLTHTLIPLFDKLTGDKGAIALLGLAFAGPLLANIDKVKIALTALSRHPLILVALGATAVGTDLVSDIKKKGVAEGLKDFFFGGKKGLTNLIPGFQSGGVVPGPMGAPRLAVVHGGERITPASGRSEGGASVVINFYAPVDRASVAREIRQLLAEDQRFGAA